MTTKLEQRKNQILRMMRDLPIVSTDQVSMLFSENGSPSKRASETMRALVSQKLVEGKRREIGRTKIWRLTSDGRSHLQLKRRHILPMNSPKVEHTLAIGEVWINLYLTGNLQYFRYEPKDPFESNGRKLLYAPDAFFIYNNHAYLLEVQRTNLSTLRWADKWRIAETFFNENHYKEASWQTPEKNLKPEIVVISTQSYDVIKGESNLPLRIMKDIKPLL